MKLSVLICTRNRAKSLEMALEKFFEQRFSEEYDYEMIVVDNNSTDETKDVIEKHARQRPGRVRHIFEPRTGLTFARNTALAAADGEIIVFTDDDVLVTADWLDEIYREFKNDPDLNMLGGRVLPAREDIQPVALQTSSRREVFVFPHSGDFAMGANMAFKSRLFDQVGGFDIRFGPGRILAGGDDTDIIYRGLKAGYKLLYAPNVLVYHNHDRTTVEQACRLVYSYGKSSSAYLIKHAMIGDLYALKMLYWNLSKLPRRWFRMNGESRDELSRRRAHVRGAVTGLFIAPIILLIRRDGS